MYLDLNPPPLVSAAAVVYNEKDDCYLDTSLPPETGPAGSGTDLEGRGADPPSSPPHTGSSTVSSAPSRAPIASWARALCAKAASAWTLDRRLPWAPSSALREVRRVDDAGDWGDVGDLGPPQPADWEERRPPPSEETEDLLLGPSEGTPSAAFRGVKTASPWA